MTRPQSRRVDPWPGCCSFSTCSWRAPCRPAPASAGGAACPTTCQLNLHVGDCDGGVVKLYVHVSYLTARAGSFPSLKVYQGKKKVHPDTVTNVPLGGDDAEPLCAEVMVKAVS